MRNYFHSIHHACRKSSAHSKIRTLHTYTATLTIYLSLLLFFLIFSLSTALASNTEDLTQYQDKIKKLKKSIGITQQHLKGSKKKRSDVITELKTLEFNIKENTLELNQLKQKLNHVKNQKNRLENEIQQYDQQIQIQRSILAAQIRSTYSIGQQKNLKMILNQQDPEKISRMQTYMIYFNRARTHQISRFIESMQQKNNTEQQLEQTLSRYKQLLNDQKENTKKRQTQHAQRKTLLSELNDKIKSQENTLSSLMESRSRIENLLESLGELLADIPSNPSENKPFKTLKGKLPWPATGGLHGKFGKSKNTGDLKWNGVLIKTKPGTPIRAVSHGRVAFSDWLQGFGFITIIDHGDGYMSLYGNSESLHKSTGDWVSSGEVIASAGNSGGQLQSGVYFEIRSRGKPVNPSIWCSSKAKHTDRQVLH